MFFAAMDQLVERHPMPPGVMNLGGRHMGVLFGASEWRIPADPKPLRLDHNFQRVGRADARYPPAPGEGETDLETIGITFLDKMRPLASQMHPKLAVSSKNRIIQI